MPIILKYISVLFVFGVILLSDIFSDTTYIMPLLIPLSVVMLGELIVCFSLIFHGGNKDNNDEFKGYQYLCSHLLLMMFSFGIWELIWVYKTTKYINSVSKKSKLSVVGSIILYLIVPYYYVIWNYQVAAILDKNSRDNGINSNIAPTCILLSFFTNLVTSVLIQAKINDMTYITVKKNKDVTVNGKTIEKLKEISDDISFNLILHTVLCLFTCGVWNYIWVYKTTNRLNLIDPDNQRSQVTSLLLYILVPYYYVVWNCKTSKIVGNFAQKVYMDSDISKTCLVFSIIFNGLITPVLIQYKLNSLSSL